MKLALRGLSGCLGISMIVLFCFMFTGCGFFKKPASTNPTATDTTIHKLSVSAFEIANAVNSGEKEYEDLYNSNLPGVSDDDYAKTVATIFLSTESCTINYITQLKSLATVDDSNKAQVVGWTNTLLTCVNTLINNGVAGIKNADAKTKIQGLLAPIPAAVKIITDLLGMQTQTTSTVRCREACASLIFTEVKLGPNTRGKPYRPGNSIAGKPFRLPGPTQESSWAFRSGPAHSGWPDQRSGNTAYPGVPEQTERRPGGLGLST